MIFNGCLFIFYQTRDCKHNLFCSNLLDLYVMATIIAVTLKKINIFLVST